MMREGSGLTQTKEGVLINLRVIPGSREDNLEFSKDSGVARVHVKAQAREGKANERLIKVLRKSLGVCEIISGRSSRDKVVLIKNASVNEVLMKINILGGVNKLLLDDVVLDTR